MYKMIFYMMLCVVWTMLMALQTDEEAAVQVLFEGKRGVNRAAHAAAQQLDEAKLAQGIVSIDEEEALRVAKQYLQKNLRLDEQLHPLTGTMLEDEVELLLFEVINETYSFPYTYRAPEYNYSVTLQKPGVVMVIGVQYPRAFRLLEPIEWEIKGASELVFPY
ncbi:hypothetical protein [Marinicrinis lubricantis]|uniref:Uncharacterized protein n=1 Tax=Marinicrinis lubricantis TaxID=2086470 RepID=A0ABW1IJG5_9BACL